MIGLITLFAFGLWLWVAGLLARALTRLLGLRLLGILLYPFIAAIPFADEAIGRWQFHQLCESEAKVWVASNIKNITAAREGISALSDRSGFIFPIREQAASYVDAETGKPFYSFKAFHTPGGFVMRSGLNLGNSTSCWPEHWTSRENGFDIDEMLKRGKDLASMKENDRG